MRAAAPVRPPRRSARTAQRSLDFRKRTRGGKLRKKPGRKRTVSDPRHRPRPEVDARHPVHVVLRVTRDIRTLRGFEQYHALRGALGLCAARSDFRAVHVSIQSSHVHLVCDAESKRALARGMQGFTISAAKRLNRVLGRRRGRVFAFRYHATAITSPTQARNAIRYVLNNWLHHGSTRRWPVDPYSSAWSFFGTARPREPLPTVGAQSWLLREGWKHIGEIGIDEVPP